MFRWLMFKRPPPRSYFQRGTPAHLSFSTTDSWPLQMEAHQKLERSLDPSCCGKIKIDIVNADRYPGTVSLELMLVNGELVVGRGEHTGAHPGRAIYGPGKRA